MFVVARPAEAFQNQPFGAMLFLLALGYLPVALWGTWTGRPVLEFWLERPWYWASGLLMLLFFGSWIYKIVMVRGSLLP